MQKGLVFNIQKYSIQDGPGIRTTVFLKGCPLHCGWCHNPESISPQREIIHIESRCIGCRECRLVCAYGSSVPGDKALPPHIETCVLCQACVEACPTQARQVVGKEMSVAEVLKTVLQDEVFYEDSGGGVTFSGGEPLFQPDFLGELLEACRRKGLHTTVDTCGLTRPENLLAIAPFTNLFLYDLKLMDEQKHLRYTGSSNRLILENLRLLSQLHAKIWIRVPIIPGINNERSDLEATARFIASIRGVRQVNLLPFHQTGVNKSRRLGRPSAAAEMRPPSEKAMDSARKIIQGSGLAVVIGG